MAASVHFRPHNRDLGMVMREVDEDLAIFLGMRSGDKERNDDVLIENSNEFDDSTSAEPKADSLLAPESLQLQTVQILADDNLLDLETDSSDHDWLLAHRDTSLLTSEVVNAQDSGANETDFSSISVKSELANNREESASAANLQLATSTSVDSSAAANRRPLSSGCRKPAARAATPTRRSSLPAKSKPSRASTPTSRATSEPSRAASNKATLPSAKPMAAVRSSTPSRATSRSSTPASRPTIPASSKPASRSATPTRKPATPLGISASDAGRKTGTTMLKNPVPSLGISQTVRSRPSKPSEMLSRSHDASQNLKTSMPKRPASASRERPSAPAPLSSSSNGKPRQKSCSPAKVRAPNGAAHKIGNAMLSRSRGYGHGGGGGGDDVNPVLMGTKMVERVVNMRKLAPPKQDEHVSFDNPKKSSQANSGFGRSLSNRSLEMAIRHMDIRRSVQDNLRPVATAVRSSSAGGNQYSSSSQSSTMSLSESPLTSASDSSKSSNCIDSYFLDGRRMDD